MIQIAYLLTSDQSLSLTLHDFPIARFWQQSCRLFLHLKRVLKLPFCLQSGLTVRLLYQIYDLRVVIEFEVTSPLNEALIVLV